MNDAAWFYSSLAQVSAAIVAFLGGFLLLRLQDYERAWQDVLVRLRVNQARWTWEERNQPDAGFSWNELTRAIEEQKQASVPKHIFWSGACLAILFFVGSMAPLLALGAPSDPAKRWFLIPVAALVLAFVLIAFFRSLTTLKELKAFELWPRVEGMYVTREAENEGWAEREKQEAEDRRKRQAAEGADDPKGDD